MAGERVYGALVVIGGLVVASGRPVLGWAILIGAALGGLVQQRIAWLDRRGIPEPDSYAYMGVFAMTCAGLIGVAAVAIGV